jgi:hypothetical protein
MPHNDDYVNALGFRGLLGPARHAIGELITASRVV